MSVKKIVVTRVYDNTGKVLIGCGIYNTKTGKTDCKSIAEATKMIANNELSNMRIDQFGRISGTNQGVHEFNRLTAIKYIGGNEIDIVDHGIYILSFDNKDELQIIKPNGGAGTIKRKMLISQITNGDARPSNFSVIEGKIINDYEKANNEVKESANSETTIKSKSALAEIVTEKICKLLKFERYGKNRLETNKGYSIEINIPRSGDGLEIRINKSIDIEKYASPEKYGFIFEEYDHTFHIVRDYATEQYDKLINSYKPKFQNFKTNIPIITGIKEQYYLSLGDKEWLTAEHYIMFNIPIKDKKEYSEKDIGSIADIMLNILGWG